MLSHLPPSPPKVVRQPRVGKDTPLPLPPVARLHFDGSCNPNPGPMGIGYLLSIETRSVVTVGAQIGQGTNNQAEYEALISGMRHALKFGLWNLEVYSDSLLVVNQMSGSWAVREARLKRLYERAKNYARLFPRLSFKYVPREENLRADDLSRKLHFSEPELPPPLKLKQGNFLPSLLPWQAAAVRVWWLNHHPGATTLADIYGLGGTAMEKIGHGETYKDADFVAYDAWIANLFS